MGTLPGREVSLRPAVRQAAGERWGINKICEFAYCLKRMIGESAAAIVKFRSAIPKVETASWKQERPGRMYSWVSL
ncbi:MAG: hypothetical protein L0H75_02625, partial [Nitrosospira sp.]|nr:hypothetical protein [Nitrosospira sp.]